MTKRIAFVAEDFCFGPQATLAQVVSALVEKLKAQEIDHNRDDSCLQLAFIGSSFSTQLQTKGLFARFETVTDEQRTSPLFASKFLMDMDVVVVFMDWSVVQQVAALPRNQRPAIVFIDCLTWFWDGRALERTYGRSTLESIDLYVAQNFLGVKEALDGTSERANGVFSSMKRTVCVPPLVDAIDMAADPERTLNIVNMGGLKNPLIEDPGTMVSYASTMINASCLQRHDWEVFTSTSIAHFLNSSAPTRVRISTLSPEAERTQLSKAQMIIMTPGLGNIFNVMNLELGKIAINKDQMISYGPPTILLPPANNSQGMQQKLLKEWFTRRGIRLAAIDWEDIYLEEIDYTGDPGTVHFQIRENITQILNPGNGRMRALLERTIADLQTGFYLRNHRIYCPLPMLAEELGTGGIKQLVKELIEFEPIKGMLG
jgi:hypothetical protein